MTTIQDNRTPEQRSALVHGVAMTDAFMSGWGGAKGGTSVAIWACPTDWLNHVEQQIRKRGEARRVRTVDLRTYRPRPNVAHVHVYVVTPDHVYSPMREAVR